MEALLREYLPHAPNLGLYVAPEIPRPKLRAALSDYGRGVTEAEVLALFDATRLGSGKDGALFLADRFVFQNNNLNTPQTIRYDDIVRVESKRAMLGGRKVEFDVNRGRATVTEKLDFSGQPGAAEFVERFLHEAMIAGTRTGAVPHTRSSPRTEAGSDIQAVRQALDQLKGQGVLAESDHLRLVDLLRQL